MNFYIALDKDNHKLVNGGATIQSHIIYIPPGNVALLSLYNMIRIARLEDKSVVDKSCLTVKKLSFSHTGDIDVPYMCDKTINLVEEAEKLLRNRTVLAEPVYQCGCPWTINPCSNFSLIPTPGFYVLETDELDQLSEMYVEYAVLPASAVSAIPDDFKLGSKS